MCKECEIKPVYEFTNKRKLCKNCFIRWFQKKFLYTIRKFEMVKKGNILGYYDKKDFKSVVLKDLLKFYVKKAPVAILIISEKTKNKADKLVLADTADSVSLTFIKSIFSGKPENKLLPYEAKIIRPLYLFLNKEVLIYANLRKLKYKKIVENKDNLSKFVGGLEKKHPELKQAVVQSYLELNN